MFEDSSPIIYHNARCSKSRATLKLLVDQGLKPRVIEYLQNPPSSAELREILQRLGISPRALMRRKETEYRESGLDDPDLSEQELLDAMSRYPKIIERPIVLANGKAALGRPPENVLRIL